MTHKRFSSAASAAFALVVAATTVNISLGLTGPRVAHAQSEGVQAPAPVTGIIVQGTGEVNVTPDLARITLGVANQAKEAAEAARVNAQRTDAVIKALRAAGVDAKDIRTSDYSVNPQYDYRPQEQGKPPLLTGYQVNNSVRVTVRQIANVGKVIDAAIGASANVAGGIEFDLANPEPVKDEALRRAVAEATRKARVIAKATGYKSMTVATVIENGEPNFPRPMMEMAMARGKVADAATPVSPGEQKVTATVTVRFLPGPEPGVAGLPGVVPVE